MSLGFKICLASNSTGVITQQGVAVEGAVIQRKVMHDEKEYIDEVITGADGLFSFSAIYERSFLKYFPIQPVLSQEVTITANNERHSAWRLTKKNWDYLGEVNSGQSIVKDDLKPMAMRCELFTDEYSRYIPETTRGLHGKCLLEWEKQPENK